MPAEIDPLVSWDQLNKFISTADEPNCKVLLTRELSEKRRLSFLYRIHSRLNKVRADRERDELKAQSK